MDSEERKSYFRGLLALIIVGAYVGSQFADISQDGLKELAVMAATWYFAKS